MFLCKLTHSSKVSPCIEYFGEKVIMKLIGTHKFGLRIIMTRCTLVPLHHCLISILICIDVTPHCKVTLTCALFSPLSVYSVLKIYNGLVSVVIYNSVQLITSIKMLGTRSIQINSVLLLHFNIYVLEVYRHFCCDYTPAQWSCLGGLLV